MVLTPLVRGLLGIDVDAPARHVDLAPHLPPEWDSVRVDNVIVGAERLTVRIHRGRGLMEATVERTGGLPGPLEFIFAPALPVGAVVEEQSWSEGAEQHRERSAPGDAPPFDGAGDIHASVQGRVVREAVFRVKYREGWTAIPPAARPAIGDRSSALRVISERLDGQTYVLTLEGRAGRSYAFPLRAPSGGMPVIETREGRAALDPWPTPAAFACSRLTFPAGGDADGYLPLTLRLRSR